jgi:hypothetical protein
MGLPMMLDLLVTRAYIDSDMNPFLSAICDLAQKSGGCRSEKKQLEYVETFFTTMTMHHGSREMLSRLKRARPSSFKWSNLNPWAKLTLAITLGNTVRRRSTHMWHESQHCKGYWLATSHCSEPRPNRRCAKVTGV